MLFWQYITFELVVEQGFNSQTMKEKQHFIWAIFQESDMLVHDGPRHSEVCFNRNYNVTRSTPVPIVQFVRLSL